jgi:hypothetical protein
MIMCFILLQSGPLAGPQWHIVQSHHNISNCLQDNNSSEQVLSEDNLVGVVIAIWRLRARHSQNFIPNLDVHCYYQVITVQVTAKTQIMRVYQALRLTSSLIEHFLFLFKNELFTVIGNLNGPAILKEERQTYLNWETQLICFRKTYIMQKWL